MDTNTDDEFCPNCKSILLPVELDEEDLEDTEYKESGLYLRCNNCSFARPTNYFTTTHFTKGVTQKNVLNVDPARIKDLKYSKEYEFTKQLPCANKDCTMKKGENPEIMLIKTDKSVELGYLCTECDYLWGKF